MKMSKLLSFLDNFVDSTAVKIYKEDNLVFAGKSENARDELEKDYNIVPESVEADGETLKIRVK